MDDTKFEKDLKEYFPKIHKLHQLGKFDPFIWQAVYSMLEFYEKRNYGRVEIVFQDGKINLVRATQDITAGTDSRQEATMTREQVEDAM